MEISVNSRIYSHVKCYALNNELEFNLYKLVSFKVCVECRKPIDLYMKSLLKSNETIHDNFRNDLVFCCEHKNSLFKNVKIYSASRKHAYIILTPLNPTFIL